MKKTSWILIACILFLLCFNGCSNQDTTLSKEEFGAVQILLGNDITSESLANITSEALTEERKEKFPSVKKVYQTPGNDFIFISQPVAYNGPITLAVAIDGQTSNTIGIQIVKHHETDHYVRDMQNNWFTDRFRSKPVGQYLDVVHLEAQKENEIIIITGATVTTQGIVNGVNAALGVYQEYVLGQTAQPVELMVEGFEGPEEE